MTIDLTKIKVGDKVRLGGEFEVGRAEIDAVRIVAASGGTLWVYADMIAEHIPAPKQFAIGQKVKFTRNGNDFEVRGQDGDTLLVRSPSDVYAAINVSNVID